MNKDKLTAIVGQLISQTKVIVDDELHHLCKYGKEHIDNFTDEDQDWLYENAGYVAAAVEEAIDSLVITDIVETINQTIAEPI